MTHDRAGRAGAVGAAVAGSGAALGAATAAACCVGPVVSPFIVAALGVGGSVAVAGLRPYTPYLRGASLLAIVVAWRLAYRRPVACAVDVPRPAPGRLLRVMLWGAAAVWTASLLITVLVRS